ncbi:MAG: hypothetical protein AMJ45_01895 [Syntrophobacter sp. DG_60]|nr:MAG: hypothetical protein AMJ45_01895 [Syntrophobacter sp. DG_60]
MGKVRVHQLAKQFHLKNKEFLDQLEQMGIIVKNHMSALADDEVERIKRAFTEKRGKPRKEEVVIRRRTVEPEPTIPPTIETSEQIPKEPLELEQIAPTLEIPKEPEPEAIPVIPKPEKPKKKKKEKEYLEEEPKRGKRLLKRHRQVVVEMHEEELAKPERPQLKPSIKKPQVKPIITIPKPIKRRIEMEESITVAELARAMGVKTGELIKKLISLGVMATVNQPLDYETATLAASEFDYEVKKVGFVEEEILKPLPDRPQDLKPRPPVVTVMGHVDHGKTSLLDVVRHTNVTSQEAGSITQHIGAYYVSLDKGDIVFLDTPGHEAFTAMRARGAQVTDVVVLVVAADDGVMAQTKEAINHAKEAGVPIVVAINKIDKPNAKPEPVKQALAELGLVPEQWGGNTLYAEVSAKKKIGIEELLEQILLQAEILELKANPKKPARGVVIEARLDKGKGPVASILVKEGLLKAGDYFICGLHYGRIRAMFNDKGQRLISTGPSIPVEVHGLSGVPEAGDHLVVVESEKTAKEIGYHRKQKQREASLVKASKVSLEDLYQRFKEGKTKELKLIIKADVQGSVGALNDALQKLSTDEIRVNIIHASAGAITESDVMLASASDAIIIGFNVRPSTNVQELSHHEKVDIHYYDVIYRMIGDIQNAMIGMLEPEYQERIIGYAQIRQLFKVPKVGVVAGCYVNEGKIERGAKVRIVRDGTVIYDGKIGSLKRFKEDVKEVIAGYEFGISFENFQDMKEGDSLEAYLLEEVKRTIPIQ